MKKFKFFLLVLFIIPSLISAQEFNSSVDKTTIGKNERFNIYFTFQGGDLNKISNFNPPSFDRLRILSGPNESRSMQIINGQVSGSLTYSFVAVGQKLGKVKIGKSSITYNGKKLISEPLSINIVKSNITSTKQNVDKKLGISEEELNKNVFIRAIPNKRKIKQGEQLIITYKLYTKLNISSPQISKLPTYKGFWAEDLETSNNIQFSIEMYNGKRYRSAVIKKTALFPSKSGKLTVTPFELKIPVIVKTKRNNNDIFDDFFNDSFFGRTETIEHTAKSNKITINVKPLPTKNVPKSFTGAVGNFNFKVELNKTKVETNEPITVKAKISGTGNISLVKLPKINFPAGFEKYEPKTNLELNKKNIVSGKKDIEFIIVPRIPGTKIIKPIEFSYFDLRKNDYVTIKSDSFKIAVKQGENSFTQTSSGYTKEDVKLLNKDIRFIKTNSTELIKKESLANITVLFILGLIFPLIGLLAVLIFKNRQDKLTSNVTLYRSQNAEKNAKKKLKDATKSMEKNDLTGYYNNLSIALFGYLSDKLSINNADFTIDRAIAMLKEKNIDNDLIDRIKNISEKCEFARFAPNAIGNDSGTEIYKTIDDIITEINTEL
ncbi:MAG: hypothetical protein CR986_03860 [Ignavibacteriae bacterium]|nr:MAG: hypothetical protein CR986_03860 [Ignavibacteriota bacterium]